MHSFGKGRDSRKSHEIKLSGMTSISLLISPNHRTNNALGIRRGSIPMYAGMFWVTLAGDSTSFWCGVDTGFHDAHIIYVG